MSFKHLFPGINFEQSSPEENEKKIGSEKLTTYEDFVKNVAKKLSPQLEKQFLATDVDYTEEYEKIKNIIAYGGVVEEELDKFASKIMEMQSEMDHGGGKIRAIKTSKTITPESDELLIKRKAAAEKAIKRNEEQFESDQSRIDKLIEMAKDKDPKLAATIEEFLNKFFNNPDYEAQRTEAIANGLDDQIIQALYERVQNHQQPDKITEKEIEDIVGNTFKQAA